MCGCTRYTKEEPIASLYLKLPCSSYCTRCFVFFQSFPCPSLTLQTSTIPLFAANLWKFKRMKRPCGWSTFSRSHKILLSFKREKLLKRCRCNLPLKFGDRISMSVTRFCAAPFDTMRTAYTHLHILIWSMQTSLKAPSSKNAAVKSRTAQKLVAGAEASRCMQSWQYARNYSGGGFLRAKNSPGAQRTLQESFLIPRGASVRRLTRARNYLHSYQSSS